MALPTNRLVAAAVALLVSAALVIAIAVGTGSPQAKGPSQAAAAAQSYCRHFAADTAVSASAQPWRGRYINRLYDYALTIPQHYVGYAPASAPARDLVIPLAAQPSALLRVDAAYDVLYDITAAGVHTRDRVDVALFDRLLSDRVEPFSLAGVAGGRYRMQVLCRADREPIVLESIIVVRNREIYRLDLKTRTDRLREDEALLEAMAASWSWIR
ncbi:MAG TPA: hypothetical protein VMF64_02280 [Steroidobacteraceae bacterium]|nr:hypothetical protein [Steroidobacteraceae bacterium]